MVSLVINDCDVNLLTNETINKNACLLIQAQKTTKTDDAKFLEVKLLMLKILLKVSSDANPNPLLAAINSLTILMLYAKSNCYLVCILLQA